MEDLGAIAIEAGLSAGASFVDIRFENTQQTQLDVVNGVTRNTSLSTTKGAGIRAFVDGSWAFGHTNELTAMGIRETARNVAHMSLATRPWVSEHFEIEAPTFKGRSEYKVEGPINTTPVEDKVSLANEIGAEMSAFDKRVVNSRVVYRDVYTELHVLNSLGTNVSEAHGRIVIIPFCTAKDHRGPQQAHAALGFTTGLGDISSERIRWFAEEPSRIALSLLDSKAMKGGIYDVLADPALNGAMIHEAFGHACEGDSLTGGTSVLQDRLDTSVGPEHINLVDDPTLSGHVGSFTYDWEGTKAKRRQLVKSGILSEFIHTLDTSSRMNMIANGGARAMTFMFPPITRMSNTFMEPGDWQFDELVKDTKEGVLLCNVDYGYTDSTKGQFMFKATHGRIIDNGELGGYVRDASIAGLILDILSKIDACCDDFFYDVGSCGTQGQMAWVMSGGPHVRIRQVPVGGL